METRPVKIFLYSRFTVAIFIILVLTTSTGVETTAEVTPHSSSIAGPIFNSAGEIVATIVVRGPESRMTAQRGSEIAPLIVEVAFQISQELGFSQNKPATKAG